VIVERGLFDVNFFQTLSQTCHRLGLRRHQVDGDVKQHSCHRYHAGKCKFLHFFTCLGYWGVERGHAHAFQSMKNDFVPSAKGAVEPVGPTAPLADMMFPLLMCRMLAKITASY